MNINDIPSRFDFVPLLWRFERFFSKRKRKGCWEWTGSSMIRGYGSFRVGGRAGASFMAHRVAWVVYRGPIPEGLLVCHHCDNPACVNPDHLFLGTQRENTHDMMNKGRQRFGGKGVVGDRRLTAEDVLAIRLASEAGELRNEAALRFGISVGTVSDITSGKTWKDVGGPIGSRSDRALRTLVRGSRSRDR